MNLSWGALHAGLQSVLDTALDAVVVMGREGQVLGWNGRAESCFGWTADEALGRQLSELIIPERFREAHARGLARYLETGEGPVIDRHIEISALHKDGREIPVELSITASDQFGDKLFIGFIRDIRDRHALAERQQRLLQESDHRVKNMLTVIGAIAQQTLRNSASLDEFKGAFLGRLETFARAHRLLLGLDVDEVPLSALAEQVLGSDVAEGRAAFSGPEVQLKPRQVLGLSMILHELYTNAVKYGALCTDQGSVRLEWSASNGEVELVWSEDGPTCEPAAPSSGYGAQMIDMSARSDLNGKVERDWRPEGLTFTLRFPLEASE